MPATTASRNFFWAKRFILVLWGKVLGRVIAIPSDASILRQNRVIP